MAIKFVSIEISLILLILVNCYSFSILTDLTQCISYRFVPCRNGMVENVKEIIDIKEEVIKFNKTDCISYQFLPCRDGWESLTIVYQNASKNEKQTNCEANTKLENAIAELAKTLELKNYCETNLTNCNEEKFNCSSEHNLCEASFADCQNKETDYEERYNKVVKEKKILSAYMASFYNGKTINEDVEKSKTTIKDRMQDYIRYSAARLGLSELKPPNITQLKPEFGPVYNDILTFRYPLNIASCNKSSNLPTLFIAVTSLAALANDNNQKRRDEIRQILKRDIKSVTTGVFEFVQFGFFLERTEDANIQRQIEEESRKNGDIVQIDIIDSDISKSLKMAAVFNWMRLNCAQVDIVFMMDENFEIVSLVKITAFLQGRTLTDSLVFGVSGDTGVFLQDGKRRISEEEYPWIKFTSNFNRLAYIVTGVADVIPPLMAAFQTIPIISLENIYLSICIIKADLNTYVLCGSNLKNNRCF